MHRFNRFQALWMSFYSKSLYRDVARHWPGVGFLYLLLLVALAWIPEAVQLQVGMVRGFDEFSRDFVSQIPEIKIQEGKASVNPPGPHFIKDPESGQVFVIIDTSGERTSLDNEEAAVLITETQFFLKNENRGETRIVELERIEPWVSRVDQDVVRGWLGVLRTWFPVLFYVLAVPFAFVYRMLQALLYGAIGMLFVRIVKGSLAYAAVLRLACVAVSPAVWLATLHDVMNQSVPFFSLLCFLVAMTYLFWAVKGAAEVDPAADQSVLS